MNMTQRHGMTMEHRELRKQMIRILAAMITFLALTMICGRQFQAATLKTSAKPKFVLTGCRHTQGKVTLTWKKVKGAKKYIVYYAKKKNGKYKKFATTKQLSITKEAAGEYYYKVQAISGNIKSKMSKMVHLFATYGNIYQSKDSPTLTIYIGGFPISRGGGTRYYYSAAKNLTKKKMTFTKGDTCQFIQLNTSTGEIEILGTGTIEEDVTIDPGKDASFTVKASRQTVDTGTVLVIQVPFTAGGQTFTLNIAREPMNTWVPALTK